MILGIDLGTTNSLASVWRDGRTELVPNAVGDVLTPSAVSIDEAGQILVGVAARERLSTCPDRSVAAFKRAMGTAHAFRLGKRAFRAEELSALVLGALRLDAERHLGAPVTEAVITVPAYFSDAQRQATKTAGALAGLDVRRLLNEPTAAALAYGLHAPQADLRIMVLDLGGGTFDVSILEMFEGVMEVRATAGDNALGGEDFAAALMDGFIAARPEARIPPRPRDLPVHARLRQAAERAKRGLTDADQTDMRLVDQGREFRWTVTRDRFETLAAPLLARIRAPVERALRDAKLAPTDVTELVLAGGATRMPVFRRLVARLFQRLPIATINPDEVVAIGAAVQAGLIARDRALDERVMTDVAPYSMGIEVADARDGQIVAAALYLPVIERNTVIPASREVEVRTVQHRQRSIAVRVFQGEARMVADNIPLGELRLGVPPAPAGEQSVSIRFSYDASGLLEVDTRVAATGTAQNLVIENRPGALTPEQITHRLAALAKLKRHPRDDAENQAVLARAERIYAERLGEERARVAARLDAFRQVIDRQDPADIAAERTRLTAWLDGIDGPLFQ